MKKLSIINQFFIIGLTMILFSCSQNLTEKQKQEIALEVFSKQQKFADTIPFIKELRRSLSLNFKARSGGIEVDDARKYHQDYLTSSNPILVSGQILHSLLLGQKHLDTLTEHATNGLRLYLLKEGSDLSIAIVAVGANDKNVLTDPVTGKSIVVNKLDPCPTVCVGTTAPDKNDISDLNYHPGRTYWAKPNLRQGLKYWVDKDDVVKE